MITLNPRDGRPIYEQIKESFRRLILTGAMTEGEKMPSVRQLAASLAINPNTIQRAYAELESEGFLASYAGKGSFVTYSREAAAARKEQLLAQMADAARQLAQLGVTETELAGQLHGWLQGGNRK